LEVPKLLFNKNPVVWWLSHWTAKLYDDDDDDDDDEEQQQQQQQQQQ
jgi:hypothetical protein